jgi:hypothetical protein
MVSYADEIDFVQLLNKLLKERHNGFMRITSGPDEGFILFKEGKQVAAEYGRFSKSDALETIMSATQNNDTVIEVFDLKSSNIDYLQDVNKPFLMEPDFDVYKIINELKGTETEPTEEKPVKKESKPAISEPEQVQPKTSKTENEPVKGETEPAISELIQSKKEQPDSDLQGQVEKSDKILSETDSKSSEIETSLENDSVEPAKSESGSEGTGEVKAAEEMQITADTAAEISSTEPEPETDVESVVDSSKTVESTPADVSGLDETISTDKSKTEDIKTTDHPETDATKPVDIPKTAESPKDNIAPESSVDTEGSVEPDIPDNESETIVKTSKPEESVDPGKLEIDNTAPSKESLKEELKSMEAKPVSEVEPDVEVKEEPMDRSKLMEKYGIKEMNEDDVDGILDDYKGGSLNDDDVEKIEFSLMNKIKKSIFGIPKIKGAEVMVFLENSLELTGDINIIIEYETKGFFSRLMGESKDIDNLRRQVINIVQIEIKKSFRKFPEIVSNFNINVEIS